MMQKTSWVIAIAFVCFCFCFCAKEGFPPGGPRDTIPPKILSGFPSHSSVNVSIDTNIEILFSESMDKEKTQRSIFISPGAGERFGFKWDRRKLVIRPPKLLLKEKTYTVTVGISACDVHNNYLAESFCFAFSTGEEVDQGEIHGRVLFSGTRRTKVSVWAYPLNDRGEPDPSLEIPMYVMQSDENGSYALQHLSLGKYRLFAVDDINGNLNWEIDEEPIGVAARDIMLTQEKTSQGDINFVMVHRDSAAPELLGCQLLDKSKLELDFSEEMDSISLFDLRNYDLSCQVGGCSVAVINAVYLPSGQPRKACLLMEGLSPQESYRLMISGLTDRWSNKMDTSLDFCTFFGTDKSDTVAPEVFLTRPSNGERGVSLDTQIKFFFNEPVNPKSVQSHFVLEDQNEKRISGDVGWTDSIIFVFAPDESLRNGCIYRARLEGRGVLDLTGNRLSDSLFEVVFTTLVPETLGQISGRIEISDVSYRSGIIVVTASKPGSGPAEAHTQTLKTAGAYRFADLLPGIYTISAFVDLNENGKLDFGNPVPFVPAEPQTCYPDSIKVRSRWETGAIDLIF